MRVDALVKNDPTNMENDNDNKTAWPNNIHRELFDLGCVIIRSSSSNKVDPRLSDIDDLLGDTSWNFEPNFSKSLIGSYFWLMIAAIPSRK